ncbi:MAG: hypothetical protein AAFV33_23420 [Chloroflexota bacterium]
MFLIVQTIVTEWGKAARGGKAASMRSRVPEALPIPDAPEPVKAMCVYQQTAKYTHIPYNEPHLTSEVYPIRPAQRHQSGCVQIHVKADELTVTYVYGIYCAGAPQRSAFPKIMPVRAGKTARVVYNGRFGFANQWRYRKTAVNIILTEKVERSVFLSEPDHIMQDIAHLR